MNEQRQSVTNLAIIAEGTSTDNGEQDDDDTSSKGSFNEKVINTNYSENEKVDAQKDAMLRRKSLAPIRPE